MNWLQHPIVLEGKKVRLVPLEHDHFDALTAIGSNPAIWEFMSIKGYEKERLLLHLKSALLKRGTGEQYPFTVIDKRTGNIIGSTMFHNISAQNRKLEIGWTWYDPAYWRTGYNRECKLLLLTHCFETLKTIRVQFQTDETNKRSYTAIMGIGAKFEGVLRHERIRENGVFRNTAMFSILDSEWDEVKKNLSKD